MTSSIEYQMKISMPLEVVQGNQDYKNFARELELLKRVIELSPLDQLYMKYFVELAESRTDKPLALSEIIKAQEKAFFILRSSILRKHLKLSLRSYAVALAATPLYRDFCGVNTIDTVVPSKSFIHDLENSMSPEFLKETNDLFNNEVLLNKELCQALGLEYVFEVRELYADSTCVKANIHYPVDWVLFRDMIRTSMLKVTMIRSGGIKERMSENPSDYLTQINRLCIEMHGNYGTEGAVKKRKKTFRKMKALLKKAMGHVQRHLELFQSQWQEHGFSEAKAASIVLCLTDILARKDKVVEVAHKRIISEKVVARGDKILSIYEDEVHVIKRNKHSVKSEFGNTLQIIEQEDGFIIDYDLLEKYSPGDQKLAILGLERVIKSYSLLNTEAFVGDRGYDSKEVQAYIAGLNAKENLNIEYGVTPKSIPALQEKMKDPSFKARQARRANTEAKIAHIKGIAQNPMKQKGIKNRQRHMGVSVLAHNLFKLARILRGLQAEEAIAA